MDKMALSKGWENRNVVNVTRVKEELKVTYAIRSAKLQTKSCEPRPGWWYTIFIA